MTIGKLGKLLILARLIVLVEIAKLRLALKRWRERRALLRSFRRAAELTRRAHSGSLSGGGR